MEERYGVTDEFPLEQRTRRNKNSPQVIQTNKSDTTSWVMKSRSKDRTYYGMCAFALLICLTITASSLIVCLTEPKPVERPCQRTFKQISQRTTATSDSRPQAIAVADLNHDHHLDFAIANTGSDTIDIFFGHGDGTFIHQSNFSLVSHSQPASIVIDDFNDDGHPDLAVANYATNSIALFFGYGNGRFHSPVSYSMNVGNPLFLTVGDINGDAQPDLVVSCDGTSNLIVLYGSPSGLFRTETIFDLGYDAQIFAIHAADIDADNRLDLALVDYNLGELIILHQEKDGFEMIYRYAMGSTSHPTSFVVDDLNGDHHFDVVVVKSATSAIDIFLGHGNRTFADPLTLQIDFNAHLFSIESADFNNDTLLDLVMTETSQNRILVFKGYGNGSFSMMKNHSAKLNSGLYSFSMGDFDEDGRSDIAVICNETNSVFILSSFQIVTNTFQSTYSTGNRFTPQYLAVGDVNNDSHVDLVVFDPRNRDIKVSFGFGNGSFDNVERTISFSYSVRMIALADMNNDRYLDMVIAADGLTGISVYFGQGNGSFIDGDFYDLETETYPYKFALGDFNNDTNLDIVITNTYNSSISIILRYHRGQSMKISVIECSQSSVGGRFPNDVTIGDMNSDGWLDFVVSITHNNTIVIYYGYGDGTFHGPLRIPVIGEYLENMVVGDINQDKQLDLIFTCYGPYYIGVILAMNDGTYGNINMYAKNTQSGARTIRLGDFNNDTYLDLAVINFQYANLVVVFGYGNGTLGLIKDYPIGYFSGAYDIAVGDFNEDQQMDVIVPNTDEQNIAVFLFYNEADFISVVTYLLSSARHPSSLAIGRFNNNTRLDLVVTNTDTDQISIFLDYADGIFLDELVYSTGAQSHPQFVTVIDLNKDDHVDIVVASTWTNKISVFFSFGNGSFDSPIDYETQAAPVAIDVGDFDNDSWMDLAVINRDDDTIDLFFSYNYPAFLQQKIPINEHASEPDDIQMGDINLDSHLDVVVLDYKVNQIRVFLGNGNGTLTEAGAYPTDNDIFLGDILLADFNNDYHLDIVFSDTISNRISILLGDGHGNFSDLGWLNITLPDVYSLAFGDFNNDQNLDIVVSLFPSQTLVILFGFGDGSFQMAIDQLLLPGIRPAEILVADVNQDQRDDLVILPYFKNYIDILLNYGNGSFTDPIVYPVVRNSSLSTMTLGDLNGDLILDFVVATRATTIMIYLGRGGGAFNWDQNIIMPAYSEATAIEITDLNDDGIKDIAFLATRVDHGFIGVLFGLGNGKFARLKIYANSVTSYLSAIVFGDFNLDQRQDLVSTDFGSGSLLILFQHGNEPFTNSITIQMNHGSRPVSLKVKDFDKNHSFDMAVINAGSNTLNIFQGDGQGHFIQQRTYRITNHQSQPNALVADDFNEDQYIDLAITSIGINGTIGIWLNDRNGNFIELFNATIHLDGTPSSIASADLNKDHHVDLVVTLRNTNQIVVFYGYGNGTFENPELFSSGFVAQPESLMIEDIDHDGWPDIIVVNTGTDEIQILRQMCSLDDFN